MYVKSRHHQRGHHQRGLHVRVCGKTLVTILEGGAILTEFCIMPKSHEGDIHTQRLGKTWSESKKVVVDAVQAKVVHCPECQTAMNPFNRAYFCPKCSKIRKVE